MKKSLAVMALTLAFSPLASLAQVVVRVAPPPVVVERPLAPPSPRHLWVAGYYRWAGGRYIWVPGHYVLPPRPGGVWIAPHWVARRGGWVFVAGYWR